MSKYLHAQDVDSAHWSATSGLLDAGQIPHLHNENFVLDEFGRFLLA